MLALVRTLGIAYFVAMLVAVTYPGYQRFARIEPFVLGLPFGLFWQVAWICGAVIVLAIVFLSERRERPGADRPRSGRPSPSSDDGAP